MATLYIMIGIPGSGKSTYANKFAKEINCSVHSSDNIRKELLGTQKDLSNDKEVWRVLKERMRTDLLNGKDCIVDATNISRKKRRTYLDFIKDVDCTKVAILMKTSFDESVERNNKRPSEQFVPFRAICNIQRAYQEPSLEEGFDKIIFV